MRRVALVGFEGAHGLDLVGPLEVFDAASRVAAAAAPAAPGYRVEVVSFDGAPFRSASGLRLAPDGVLGDVRGPLDTVVVAGGPGVRAFAGDRAARETLRRVARRSRRVASVCTGAFLLAEAGLLEGRRATTHWAYGEALAARYPRVRLEPDAIFVRDDAGPGAAVWTSAGVTAGMDLALALVEEDLGARVSLEVARWLVLFVQRPGGQSQFSAQLAGQLAERDALRELQAWIAEHPEADLRVEALAARVAMSPRHFARVFHAEVGLTPARYVERARVEVARRLLERTGLGLDQLADASGFRSAQRLRRAFARHLGVTPSAYRARFRAPDEEAPGWTS